MSERTTRVDELDPDHGFPPSGVSMTFEGALFAWRADEVVLLAQRTSQAYVLARGWVYGDRLVDVRRWSFPAPAALAAQVRRLAREATGDGHVAAAAATAVLAWAHAQVAAEPDSLD